MIFSPLGNGIPFVVLSSVGLMCLTAVVESSTLAVRRAIESTTYLQVLVDSLTLTLFVLALSTTIRLSIGFRHFSDMTVACAEALALTPLGILAGYVGTASRAVGAMVQALPRPARSVSRGALRSSGRSFVLAGIPISPTDATRNFKLIGSSGRSRDAVVQEFIAGVLSRKDRLVVADPTARYWRQMYRGDRGDVILGSINVDGCKWSLTRELRHHGDAARLARVLFPHSTASDTPPIRQLRSFFSGVVRYAGLAGLGSDRDLYRLLIQAPADQLYAVLNHTVGEECLAPGNEPVLRRIRFEISRVLMSMNLAEAPGPPGVSVTECVREGHGVVWLSTHGLEPMSERQAMATWLSLVIQAALRPHTVRRDLWAIFDSLDEIGPIEGLPAALTELSDAGVRCAITLQSVDKLTQLYGSSGAQRLLESCHNALVLRSDPGDGGSLARYAAYLIGSSDVIVSGEPRAMQPAQLTARIESLPIRSGFMKLASQENWSAVRWPPADISAFVRREAS
jgi:Type IV secretion-system coupling protein DNA-binding domain